MVFGASYFDNDLDLVFEWERDLDLDLDLLFERDLDLDLDGEREWFLAGEYVGEPRDRLGEYERDRDLERPPPSSRTRMYATSPCAKFKFKY